MPFQSTYIHVIHVIQKNCNTGMWYVPTCFEYIFIFFLQKYLLDKMTNFMNSVNKNVINQWVLC